MCNRAEMYLAQSAVSSFTAYVNAGENFKLNRYFDQQKAEVELIRLLARGILGMYPDITAVRLALPVCRTLLATFKSDKGVLCYLDDCCSMPVMALDGLSIDEGQELKTKLKFYKVLIKQYLMLGHAA